jgi:predicted RNase H-like nuclease
MHTHRDDSLAAGIDGCRGGWLIAIGPEIGPRTLASSWHDLPTIIGIDMPIGLSADGVRTCDLEARRRLGRRGSSVFPAPARSLLGAAPYPEANSLSKRLLGKGLSVQAYNLMAKIAELDVLLPSSSRQVVEVHPEVSFLVMNGAPLASKRTSEGLAARTELIAGRWPDVITALEQRPPGCGADDILDAYAVLWSAHRVRRGEAELFGDGRRDDRGLEMIIRA